jgi:8-oxo-dGTP pyrophosphatase MutT (NUDIX family)
MNHSDPRMLLVTPTPSGWSWQCLALRCGQASYGLPTPAGAWRAATGHTCSDPIAAGTVDTDPDVLTVGVAQGWADPELDPAEIDWPTRQASALIPYAVERGRPVTPGPRTGVYGRAGLGRWGENPAADALVTATLDGARYVLLIERGDGAGWAIPGGGIDPGETPAAACVRELAEETGLHIPADDPWRTWQAWPPRWVPDPRGTDEAWAVTVPHHADLCDVDALPPVAGGDDAADAAWIPAPDYPTMREHLTAIGGQVFAAHTGLLADLLAHPHGGTVTAAEVTEP